MGLAYKQQAQPERAATAFGKYLAIVPDAPDSGLIKHYLSELSP
jgi:regulator of sirC expression with transglutaminase-like and TPR domain